MADNIKTNKELAFAGIKELVEKLKEDILNAKYHAPNYKLKDDEELKKLAKDIQEYFINVLKEKLQNRMKDNFEKY